MPSVTVFHDDGTTDSAPATTGWELKETIGEMWRLTITLPRSDAQDLNLVRKSDEVELSGYRRGILTNVDTGTEEWVLTVYSSEWYANQEQPIDGGTRVEGDDNTLITDRINQVSEWSVGSIADLTGPLTFVFNHAFQHEALRKIEKNVPGELAFADDGTVDYVARRGTDKSGSITLSNTQGNLEKEIQIQERGRKLDATHVRVIGAHEGEAQYFANLVPADDSDTYENRVNYTTSRWSDGDPKDWDRWENKDVVGQDTIEEEAAALGDELTEEYVEAEATVAGSVDIQVGDSVQVRKDDADLDRSMRIHRLTTKPAEESVAAEVYDVLLSTRTIFRDETASTQRDIQRFNTAFQGSSVVIQGGGSRQPVTAGVNAVERIRYPPVDFEHETVVEVAGLPYRAYSSGAADNSDFSTIEEISSPGGELVISKNSTNEDTWFTVDRISDGTDIQLTPTANGSEFFVVVNVFYEQDDGYVIGDFRLENVTTGEYYPNAFGYEHRYAPVPADSAVGGSNTFMFRVPEDVRGDTLEVQGRYSFKLNANDINWRVKIDSAVIGKHTHDPDPGVIESFPDDPNSNAADELLPSNVDLLVNGSTVATDIGSGEFDTTVDITGTLNRDAFNTIAAASDSTGHVRLTISSETYKQIGTR